MSNDTPSDIARVMPAVEEPTDPTSNTIDILRQVRNIPELEMIQAHAITDGAAGLFESTDGETYEVVVRLADYAKYF